MHNLKEIRKNFDHFKKALEKRSTNINFDKLKDLDIKNRELIQQKENLEKEKKDISKSKDKSLFSKSKSALISDQHSYREIAFAQASHPQKKEICNFHIVPLYTEIAIFPLRTRRALQAKLILGDEN